MDIDALREEINALIGEIGDESTMAKPAAERAVVEKIQLILEETRQQRTGSAREFWETYLPYAAGLTTRLSKLEEGWEDDAEFFTSENAQFWLDNTAALLEKGDISSVQTGLRSVYEATKMIRGDMVMRADILLQALDMALEISDKKLSFLLYEEAEKIYQKRLTGGEQYAGSLWLKRINKIGRQIKQYREKLRRYYQYAEAITVSIQADSDGDLEKVINFLQEQLGGKIKITRRVKELDEKGKTGYQARVKITLE